MLVADDGYFEASSAVNLCLSCHTEVMVAFAASPHIWRRGKRMLEEGGSRINLVGTLMIPCIYMRSCMHCRKTYQGETPSHFRPNTAFRITRAIRAATGLTFVHFQHNNTIGNTSMVL